MKNEALANNTSKPHPLQKACGYGTFLNDQSGLCEAAKATDLPALHRQYDTKSEQLSVHPMHTNTGTTEAESARKSLQQAVQGHAPLPEPATTLQDVLTALEQKLGVLNKFKACEDISKKLTSFTRNSGSAFCGEHTNYKNGRCTGYDPTAMCGRGTQYSKDQKSCTPNLDILCRNGSTPDLTSGSCVAPLPSSFCDQKTTKFNTTLGKCVPWVTSCKAGTVYDSTTFQCKPDQQCPAGTASEAGSNICVLSPSSCGPGTTLVLDQKSNRRMCKVDPNVCGRNGVMDDQSGLCVLQQK